MYENFNASCIWVGQASMSVSPDTKTQKYEGRLEGRL